MIDCVVPAAGEARRFGAAKAVAPFLERPLILHVIERALVVCDRCIVVTGAHREAVERAIAGIDRVTAVFNPHYSRGMISSIATGAAQVSTPWFFVAPADMPRLPVEAFRRLAAAAGLAASVSEDTVASIKGGEYSTPFSVSPRYRDRPGHPVLIPTIVRDTLLAGWKRYTSMRSFLDNYPRIEIAVDDEGVVFDIDTTDDLTDR